MADIKGITIEIDGNTSKLSKAISGVNSELKSTQSTLRAVDRALKLDPSNVDLLQKKQKTLQDAVEAASQKLDTEKEALAQLKAQDDGSEEMAKKQKELEREITQTEAALAGYEAELRDTESTLDGVSDTSDDAADASDDLGDAVEDAGNAAQGAGSGWTATKQILVDLAENAIKMAIDGLKKLAEVAKDAVVDSAAYADEMLAMSTVTGLSTDTLQEFQYMSQLVDVDLDTMTGSLKKLTKSMSNSKKGTGASAEAFNKLGVSVTDSNGELRSAESVFNDTIDALGNISNETERDALAMEIFGKSAQDLNPLIEAGADNINKFAQEAHDVGYVLDEETLSSLGAVDDSFQRMQTTMEATRNKIVAGLAPALSEGAGYLLDFVNNLDWSAVGEIAGNVLQSMVDAIPEILAWLQSVGDFISGTVVPAAQSVWDTVQPTVSNVVSFIQENIPEIQTIIETAMEAIKAVIDLVWPAIETQINSSLEVVQGIIDTIMAAISGDWTSVWNNIKTTLTNAAIGIINTMRARFNAALNVAKSIFNRIKTAIQTPINAAKSAVSSAVSAIQSTINSISTSSIGSAFSRISSSVSSAMSSARSAVSNAISAMKNAFNFSWKLPDLKLPHISVKGGVAPYGIGGKGSLPSFSIQWYRKAMDNALLLNDATIFGMQGNGSLMGGGESGKEVILGLDKLKEYAGNKVVNINMTVNAAPGQDAETIARAVSREIQNEIMRKKAVWA